MSRVPGARIDGFTIEGAIGAGGFGVVYRALDARGAPVALKVLRADVLDADTAARFEREIDTLRRLEHPSIVRVLATGVTGEGEPYCAMELLTGEELSRRIARDGRLSLAEAARVLEPVCSALAAAHGQGVVHRDVKASNVFLRADGAVSLLDFGIAKILDRPGTTLTRSRQIVGTPCAMAPEQIRGAAVDARSDVYALGALAFHMLTGELPFDASAATVVRQLHQHARRRRPSERAPVPADVDRVIVRAMSTDAGERQGDASDFFDDFAAAAIGRARRSRQVRAVVARLTLPAPIADPAALAASLRERERRCHQLAAEGFRPLVRTGDGAVLLRLVDGGDDERAALAAAAAAGFRAHAGEVELRGDRAVGGPALEPWRWEAA